MYFIAFEEQKFGEVGAVLADYFGDECCFVGHLGSRDAGVFNVPPVGIL